MAPSLAATANYTRGAMRAPAFATVAPPLDAIANSKPTATSGRRDVTSRAMSVAHPNKLAARSETSRSEPETDTESDSGRETRRTIPNYVTTITRTRAIVVRISAVAAPSLDAAANRGGGRVTSRCARSGLRTRRRTGFVRPDRLRASGMLSGLKKNKTRVTCKI